MEIVGNILAEMSEADIKSLAPFLKEYQDDLIAIKPLFKVGHKGYVKEILEGRG